ncbi:5-formyltetrahydrofolate cyclo-ligase, mitochondrial-like [Aristolochia californica]|uniref:5-formyltetrahydrofolate cyclo-ligase, mitochondrial-like n=1 Tax=Aristolochia californica TaxID=171875 RepID=UPI0035E39E74
MRRNGLRELNSLFMSPAAIAPAVQAFGGEHLYSHTTKATLSGSSHPFSNITMQNDPIAQQKRALRTRVRKELKAMTHYERTQQDIAVQNFVLEAPWFQSCKSLCAYISCEALREVDTSKLLSEILGCDAPTKKKLYVPRVEDKKSHMRMLRISSIDDLIANSMNILEPAPLDAAGNHREDVMESTQPVDLLLLPGLAFDRSGRRLGRGGGYYDTFLNKYQELVTKQTGKQPLLVTLSYSVQIMEVGVIPVTALDVPVDALVSPEGVIPISPAAKERL